MSHFTVLVPARDENDLRDKLLPYHEYECTGIEQYIEFVPADMEKLQADYERYGAEDDTLEMFAQDCFGYHKSADGVYGRMTNPNTKWDWYVIGGRWTGLLQLKTFEAMEHAGDGTPGLMTAPNNNPLTADWARHGDVDWDGMVQEQFDSAMRKYDTYHEIKGRLLETLDGEELDKAIDKEMLEAKYFIWEDDIAKLEVSRDDFAAKLKEKALTFAFIDLEGKWNERGNMGWWAIVTDENPDYDQAFWKFVKTIPDDMRVYVVDCHI